jgi:RimJ/RimL family protein N-acetyltransferase
MRKKAMLRYRLFLYLPFPTPKAMKQQLFGEYTYAFCDRETFTEIFQLMELEVFVDLPKMPSSQSLTEWEKQKVRENGEKFKNVLRYHVLVYHGDKVIGWSFGIQTSHEDHLMINSGIVPAYQGQGIYSTLLRVIIEYLKAKGVQRIYSTHQPFNNKVIVPKLKAGFMISGYELDEHFGVTVVLSYFTNSERRKRFETRVWSEL